MEKKVEEPVSHVCRWIKGQISIAVVRSYSRMLHGALPPSPLWKRNPDWETGSGMGLKQ